MPSKQKSLHPDVGISKEPHLVELLQAVPLTLEQQVAAIIEQIITGKEKYESLVDAVFWLFNDLTDGAYFDEFSELIKRLKAFFFVPENHNAFCSDSDVWVNSENLYRLLDKLETFIDEVYSYHNYNLSALDLYELKQYPGQIPEPRLKQMLKDYTITLKSHKAKEIIRREVENKDSTFKDCLSFMEKHAPIEHPGRYFADQEYAALIEEYVFVMCEYVTWPDQNEEHEIVLSEIFGKVNTKSPSRDSKGDLTDIMIITYNFSEPEEKQRCVYKLENMQQAIKLHEQLLITLKADAITNLQNRLQKALTHP